MAISKQNIIDGVKLVDFNTPEERAIDKRLSDRFVDHPSIMNAVERPNLSPEEEDALLRRYLALGCWTIKAYTHQDTQKRYYIFS